MNDVVGYEEAQVLSLVVIIGLLDACTRTDNLPGAFTILYHM